MEAAGSVMIYFRRLDREWSYVTAAMTCPKIGIGGKLPSKFSRKLALVDLTQMLPPPDNPTEKGAAYQIPCGSASVRVGWSRLSCNLRTAPETT